MPPEGISFKDVITNVEKRLIESTLEAAGGVQKKAAELLKIKPTTLERNDQALRDWNEETKEHQRRTRSSSATLSGRRAHAGVASGVSRSAGACLTPDSSHQALEAPHHRVPLMVIADVPTAVLAHSFAHRRRLQDLECPHELVAIRVVQTRVCPATVFDRRFIGGVGEYRCSYRQAFQEGL